MNFTKGAFVLATSLVSGFALAYPLVGSNHADYQMGSGCRTEECPADGYQYRGYHHMGSRGEGPRCGGMRERGPHCDTGSSANREEILLARFESLGNMLNLSEEQKSLWDSYTNARIALCNARFDVKTKPIVDEQSRLEYRLSVVNANKAALENVVDARNKLLKSLSPEQKYVLENYESRHGRHCR